MVGRETVIRIAKRQADHNIFLFGNLRVLADNISLDNALTVDHGTETALPGRQAQSVGKRTQIKLAQSIERQEEKMQAYVESLG